MLQARLRLWVITICGLASVPASGQDSSSADAEGKPHHQASAWIKRSDSKTELLFTGRVLTAEGQPAQNVIVQVIDHPNPLANRPRQRQIAVEHGEFQFGSDGLSTLVVHASNADHSEQAMRLISGYEVASFAESGKFELQLQPSRAFFLRVMDDGNPVSDAKVLTRVGWSLNLEGISDANGIAKIYLPTDQQADSIRVWTDDYRIGSIDFRNASNSDVTKQLKTVELFNCKPFRVRVVDTEGKPKSGLPIHLGVSNKNHEWVLDNGLFESKTDQHGEATFAYFPDWEDERHFLYSADPSLFIQNSKDVEGIFEGTVGKYDGAETVIMQLKMPNGCQGGMLVEGWSFQSVEEHRSTVFFARLDSEGRMTADIVPGYTYNLFINDARWVSKPIAVILVDADSRKPATPEVEIVEGVQVEIRATAGADHHPVAHQWVHLETPFHFDWKENGKTRSGSGGRRWQAVTDSEGKISTRAYPRELEARISVGSSNVEKTMEIAVGVVNQMELHREVAGPTFVVGQLTAADPKAILKDATIAINQAESNFIKPTVTATSNVDGEFEAKLDCSRAIAYATSVDERFSGANLFNVLDEKFELPMLEVGVVSGRVLDENELPVSGGKVFASVTMKPGEKPANAGENWPLSLSVTHFKMNTDSDGKFVFDKLPAGFRVLIGITTADMEPNTFRSLDEVFLEAGERRENQVYRPASKNRKSIEELYSRFVRNCALMHTHGLIVVGGTDANVESLRREVLDYEDYRDVNWYLPFTLNSEASQDSETVQLLVRNQWPISKANELSLIAVDGRGDELGRLSLLVPETKAAKLANRERLTNFLAAHRIAQQDAREKLARAIEEARMSNRRVWARVSGTRCGPCIKMSNWLEDHRGFIEKAFVLVDVDAVRDLYGQEIAERLKHQGGIPWHVMLDGKGEILVTSESPIGNIGSPDASIESLKHIRKMLTDAASDLLTTEEIDALLETIK